MHNLFLTLNEIFYIIFCSYIRYTYNNEETNLISTIESHLKACRDIEFSTDGLSLFSVGKDLCIAITDVETTKLTRFYEKAHEYV